MGNCLSGAPAQLIENSDGGEEAYHKRYMEGDVLGEGEFGQVRLVHDMTQNKNQNTPYASKLLRKGVVFKDNTLYSPIKPEVLRGEVEILQKLAGKHYCLKMVSIFETPKVLYMVTEFCGGGEMMEYVGNREEDLRTEDVSRIAFQLLSAIDHCAKFGVIHRDIKPENVMFQDPTPQAELRLIDFGSGTMDRSSKTEAGDPLMHTTFAGSAFYISPEMFQRTYTVKTDVWSAGAALYVLVAGYPAEKLQKAFNIMQTNEKRNLRSLPNLPDDIPDSFFELLDGLLTYRHKLRPSAGEMLKSEFVRFHKEHEEGADLSLDDVAAAAATSTRPQSKGHLRTASISIKGSVDRHNIFLGFKKYERSLTALLAAALSKKELQQLITILMDRSSPPDTLESAASLAAAAIAFEEGEGDGVIANKEQQLSVIKIADLKTILKDEIKNDQVLATMTKLPNAEIYERFAYHVVLLKDFSNDPEASTMSSSGRRRLSGRGSVRQSYAGGRLFRDAQSSNQSTKSLKSSRRGTAKPSSAKDGRLYGTRPKPAQLHRSISVGGK